MLSIAQTQTGLQIDWPEFAGYSFALQETPRLGGADWVFAPSGRSKPVALSPSETEKFFRLQEVTPLRITNQLASPLYVLPGTNVTLRVGAEGEGVLHYQWRLDGIDLPAADHAELELYDVQMELAGDYDVVVSDMFDSVTSQPAELVLLIPLYIVQHPQSQTVAVGETVTFSVTVTNTATLPITNIWRKGFIPVETNVLYEHTSTFTIANVQPSDADNYRVSVANPADYLPGKISNWATLTVE